MERFKKKTKDLETNNALEHIYQNALGNILILPAAPTTVADMKANNIAYFNNKLYIKLSNGDLKELSVSDI